MFCHRGIVFPEDTRLELTIEEVPNSKRSLWPELELLPSLKPTASLPLKMGHPQKGDFIWTNHWFSGAVYSVSFREPWLHFYETKKWPKQNIKSDDDLQPSPSIKPTFWEMGVSENTGTPKSSILILIEFSIINHPFWGIPIFGNTQMVAERLAPPSLHPWPLRRPEHFEIEEGFVQG